MAELINIRQLLECGVHFGHPTRKWNPKMAPFIFTKRSGIHIINLEITQKMIEVVHDYLHLVVKQGKQVLFVGTKKQARDAIRVEAEKCGMPYVNQRWLGGMLTNWNTIQKRVMRLNELEEEEASGYWERLSKKDRKRKEDELNRLRKFLGGIKVMQGLPGALFVVDVEHEKIAVLEANRLGIPVIAIVDTNSDPDLVQYPLPGNDDAIRSIRLFCSIIADSIIEARYGYLPEDSVFLQPQEGEELDLEEGLSEELVREAEEFDGEGSQSVSPAASVEMGEVLREEASLAAETESEPTHAEATGEEGAEEPADEQPEDEEQE